MPLILLSAGLLLSASRKKHPTIPPPPPKPKVVGAAGLIAVAQHELDLNNPGAAAEYAKAASSRAPVLDDYAQYIRAEAEYRLKNYAEVAKSAARVFDQTPLSPFTGDAAALAVRAELDNDSPKTALDLIRKYYDRIPQPERDLLLARGFESSGDLAQAAEYYERVYYNYPAAREAADAATALAGIKQRLGDAFPVPMPSALLGRAQKLFDAGNPAASRIELAAAIPQLGGAQRDLARVRLGEADFGAGHTGPAFQYFTALKVNDPEADAERLDYLIRCVRKLDRHGDVKPFLDQLAKDHPNSLWRMDALISVADQARTDNQPSVYLPLYRSCAATFAADRRAAWCSWQVAFDSYRRDSADAADLLRAHIQKYPDSQDVDDALYFLGRLAESKKDFASARACYDEISQRFPNTYYAVIARERLKTVVIEANDPNPATVIFLHGVSWPPRLQFPSFEPGKTAQARINRSELLALTGLNDLAENELKFGARNDNTDQPNVYAFELAKQASARGEPDQGMRYIKAYAPDYLYMPLDEAPLPFWRLAFPIPYRQAIEIQSRARSLDPFLVTALIRQESEFNVKVISYAKAYGLMQILPSTGRELARHLRLRGYTSQQLLTPDRNIQLGTYYFRNLMNAFNGELEPALASYNAGESRANLWRSWGPFREPSEYIEIIPFHQTRSYIQIVLRNADVYRRLYAGTVPDVPEYKPKPRAAVHPKKRSVKSRKR